MEKIYEIGEGLESTLLTAWPRARLQELANAIFAVCGKRTNVVYLRKDNEIETTARDLRGRHGDDVALALARQLFADLGLAPPVC